MEPNIFNYATSELSQDAFICWLAQWGDERYRHVDAAMQQTGELFLDALIRKAELNIIKPYKNIKLFKQYNKIDVCIIINDEFLIAIEDKINADITNEQLLRYANELANHNFEQSHIGKILLVTGEKFLGWTNTDHFKPFVRKDFIHILQNSQSKNPILRDFLNILQNIDSDVNAFKTEKYTTWRNCSNSWGGLYNYLIESSILKGDNGAAWDYVPNPRGGFLGFWFSFTNYESYKIYLQFEMSKLCIKIEIINGSDTFALRTKAFSYVNLKAPEFGVNITKPLRFGHGKWITIAICNDFPVLDSEGKLDLKGTEDLLVKLKGLISVR